MDEIPPESTATASFNSGFLWSIEVRDAPFDLELTKRLRDSFRQAGRLQAARMEHPPLVLSFSEVADMLGRMWPCLKETNACTLPLAPLALPSGALGYLHLSAWPLLLAALEERGITADGPAVDVAAGRAAPDRSARGLGPRVRFRLWFDPAWVGPAQGGTDVRRPPDPTALELGAPHPEGVPMAGIDYLSTGGDGVRAWSAVLADHAEAWDRGGQPPIWIVHRDRHLLRRDFGQALEVAIAEAVGAIRVREPDAVAGDLRVVVCHEAAVVRIGARAGAVVRGGAYRQFVQQLAAALGRAGVPAAALLEPRHLNPSALEDLVPEAASFVVSPDADASITRLVERRLASLSRQDAAGTEAEDERLGFAAWAHLGPPVVAWLPEPSSPLFGRTPPPVVYPQVAVYVPSHAALPPNGAHQADVWLDLVLNGGKHGLDRARTEISGSRRIGAIALARALSARYLRRPLPVSRRQSLDAFRLACGQQLAGFGRLATGPELARAAGEILLASIRHPKVGAQLLTTFQDLVVSAGMPPPLVVVFGAGGARLLPVPRADPPAVDMAMALVDAGYEEDLDAIWADNPRGIIGPAHLDRAIPQLLDPVAVGTDTGALTAFARWALQDAGNRRLRGVRRLAAFVTVPEPRLRIKGIERVFFLRETEAHVIVLCDSAEGGRGLLRLPRTGDDWDRWAASPGGALLAAFLAGAYRDMVVPLDVEPFTEHPATPTADASGGPARLEPVGYLPARRRPRRRGPAGLVERVRPAPHQVTWYIRRLAPGQRAHPEALARAAAVGMTVPPGYTFVDTYFWPRATDPRSAATALRVTVAVSSLRALLQTATTQPPGLVADEASRRNGSPHSSAGDAVHPQPDPEAGLPPSKPRQPWWALWRRR